MAGSDNRSHKGRGFRVAFGFLFTAFLIIALFSYHVYKLTTFETVEKVGISVSHGMGEIGPVMKLYYPELLSLAEQNPEAELVLPGFNIDLGVKAKEIKNVPEDQAADFIVRSLLKRIYFEGFSNVVTQSNLAGADQNNLQSLTNIADTFINKKFNDLALLTFIVSAIFAILLAIPLLILSPGFKKLTGFGTSLVVAGTPGLLLAYTQARAESLMSTDPVASGLLREVIMPFIEGAKSSYLTVLLIGVGLLLIGLSGIFITRRQKAANAAIQQTKP